MKFNDNIYNIVGVTRCVVSKPIRNRGPKSSANVIAYVGN